MVTYDLIAAMPKVELHVHLEGSIRPATLLTLAQRNGVRLPADDLEGLQTFYRFTDFGHFISTYMLISSCLKTVSDFELIAYEFGADMNRQNIRYAEVTFTPHTNVTNTGLSFEAIMEGLNEGRARARADFGIEFGWVLDIVRDLPDTRIQVAEWAATARGQGVVGFGLGGTEREYPPEWFADAFELAREAGLHSVPHAGETAGPDSVWGAIRSLKAERLGHGVRSIEDPALVDYLGQHQIPLEVCPTSNLCLGIYPSYQTHPIRLLMEKGLYITVNSDDPPMFNTDLNHEYKALVDNLSFSQSDLEKLSLNALNASYLPTDRKEKMASDFESEFARLHERRF
jgi:adenosine deaminase